MDMYVRVNLYGFFSITWGSWGFALIRSVVQILIILFRWPKISTGLNKYLYKLIQEILIFHVENTSNFIILPLSIFLNLWKVLQISALPSPLIKVKSIKVQIEATRFATSWVGNNKQKSRAKVKSTVDFIPAIDDWLTLILLRPPAPPFTAIFLND